MTYILLVILLLVVYILVAELYPVRFFKVEKVNKTSFPDLPPVYLYSFELHIHTQFSYDSLGKPEDLKKASREEDIDFLVITDHDNDHIKYFADGGIIAGKEVKITDEKGKVLGDILEVGDLKVVAHPFKEKYKWRLPLPEDYLFELIDLKDALLERKMLLFFLLPYIALRSLISINLALNCIKRLVDIKGYALMYMKMGIKNPIVAGLDHHVKVYIREVGIRFLFPNYTHSFRILRNFLISSKRIESKEDFLKELKRGKGIISFSKKSTLFWQEGSWLKVLPPTNCLLLVLEKEREKSYLGSYFELPIPSENSLFLGYTYKFRLWNFYFGLVPLFIFSFREDKHAGATAS
ncbi:PHP domain-containing protein [Hydrogenobacter sp. T-2]|uniref:PHP domain-containing protein n=1 Tax=Pampinifervens diazotrophicum TaxID=1632018 RepID=UPI002B25D18F|nr:PHP domain-containing protein [Hydrogenobacter sp. T-2]WPM32292.1 PHP domain-containing protein [Hydrogenobacter sp. T-2]